MSMRSSRKHVVALIAALSTLFPLAPAFAQEASAPVRNIVLGIGADETQANIAWLTDTPVDDQELQFAPARSVSAASLAEKGQVVAAESITANIATGTTIDDVWAKSSATSKDMGRHTATISGLEANSEYIYRVGSDATGWSEVKTFTTQDFDDSWNFVFLGDPQLGSGGHSVEESEFMWKETLSRALRSAPNASFIQSAGDQLQLGNLQEHTALTAAPELQSIPFAPINGNHDNYDFESYMAYYNRPNLSADQRNYFYEYNNVLMITLDTNHINDLAQDAAYVKDMIAAHGSDKDWILVTFHHAPYSQAGHLEDRDVAKIRQRLVPELTAAGVDLVLSGHDHIYTRSHLMEGNSPVIPEAPAKPGDVFTPAANQTMFLTANSSTGTKFYDFYNDGVDYENMTREEAAAHGLAQEYTAYWEQKYNGNYTDVQVGRNELKVITKDIATGAEVDSFTLVKDNQGTGSNSSNGSSWWGFW